MTLRGISLNLLEFPLNLPRTCPEPLLGAPGARWILFWTICELILDHIWFLWSTLDLYRFILNLCWNMLWVVLGRRAEEFQYIIKTSKINWPGLRPRQKYSNKLKLKILQPLWDEMGFPAPQKHPNIPRRNPKQSKTMARQFDNIIIILLLIIVYILRA